MPQTIKKSPPLIKRHIGPLERSFLDFHRNNPWVFDRLVEICADLQLKGVRKYSMRTLITVLRFEWDLKTLGENVKIEGNIRRVKLNNNHSPYYARLLIKEYPQFRNFFELRSSEAEQ